MTWEKLNEAERKLTLVRLTLRGERHELIDAFHREMQEAENRARNAGAYCASREQEVHYGQVQEGIAGAFRRAAEIVRKRIDADLER